MLVTSRFLNQVFVGSFIAFIGSILGISYTQNTYDACQNTLVNVTYNNTCQAYVGWHTFAVAVLYISVILIVGIIVIGLINRNRKRVK